MWLMGCPNPSKFEQSWECTFLKVFTHMNTKWILKTIFTTGLQNWLLGSTAAGLAVLSSCYVQWPMIEIVFNSHFVFIWVKTFKKVHFHLCSNLLGLCQPISHMWYLHTCIECLSGISISGTHLHQPSVSPSNNLLLSWINWIESNHLKLYHNFT